MGCEEKALDSSSEIGKWRVNGDKQSLLPLRTSEDGLQLLASVAAYSTKVYPSNTLLLFVKYFSSQKIRMHAELALWKSFPFTCPLTSAVECERKGCTVAGARELHAIQALCAVAIVRHGACGTSKAKSHWGVRPFHKLFSLFLPHKLRAGAQMSSGPFEALEPLSC